MPSPLTPSEIQRYKRHLVLREVGGQGQQALKAARVLVIGAGGLGSPVVLYLAAAGVGVIGIVDDDTVSLDNLQRQVIHATSDVGRLKVESARDRAVSINPHVQFEIHPVRIEAHNAMALIQAYDIVVDGSDNFATRYLVSDACYLAKKALVFAALGAFDGYVTMLKPHMHSADGKPNPTYRCLFPEKPSAGIIPTCAEAGVLGALTGLVGTMQAMEVIREIVGFGEGLVGRLLLIDAMYLRFETVTYAWDPANPLSGTATRP